MTSSRPPESEPNTNAVRWVGANALGQAAGLTTTALLGHLSTRFGEPTLLIIAGGLVLTGLVEGALLGVAQAWALKLSGRDAGRWVGATVAAFVIWWALGALASLLEPAEPSRWILIAVALVAGGALGLLLGWLQGRLRAPPARAAWLAANATGWAAGLLLAALAADLVPQGPLGLDALLIGALGGAATGLVVGLVTAPWRP